MAVERTPSGSSLIDVLDRVLDKGIVIDAWVRVSLVGIDLVTVEARIVVASIDTYLKYSEAVGITAPMSRPREVGAGAAESGKDPDAVTIPLSDLGNPLVLATLALTPVSGTKPLAGAFASYSNWTALPMTQPRTRLAPSVLSRHQSTELFNAQGL